MTFFIPREDSDRPGDVFARPGTPWRGRTVFCLASGDSLRWRVTPLHWRGIAARQRDGAMVLAVNSSVKTARAGGVEPDAIFFSDTNWFEDNEALVRSFAGRVFTVDRRARALCDKVERIDNTTRLDFPVGEPPIRDGRSSGHRAISLAITLGAARVVMLGYDMRIDPATGRSHCHDDYRHTEDPRAYRDEFVPGFRGWNAAARAAGCEVINATEGSAVTEFPMMGLDDLLAVSAA